MIGEKHCQYLSLARLSETVMLGLGWLLRVALEGGQHVAGRVGGLGLWHRLLPLGATPSSSSSPPALNLHNLQAVGIWVAEEDGWAAAH